MRPHANWVKIKLTVYSTIIPWLLSTIIVQTDPPEKKNRSTDTISLQKITSKEEQFILKTNQ